MKIKLNKFDYMKIVTYILAIILSSLITSHFGYVAYLLNFADNIGYSYSIGSVGNDFFIEFISKNLPISSIISFLLASILTVGLIISLKNTIRDLK